MSTLYRVVNQLQALGKVFTSNKEAIKYCKTLLSKNNMAHIVSGNTMKATYFLPSGMNGCRLCGNELNGKKVCGWCKTKHIYL